MQQACHVQVLFWVFSDHYHHIERICRSLSLSLPWMNGLHINPTSLGVRRVTLAPRFTSLLITCMSEVGDLKIK